METIVENPPLKLESLKVGANNINKGHSFQQAIKLIESLNMEHVSVFTSQSEEELEITSFSSSNRHLWDNVYFITDYTGKEQLKAMGKRKIIRFPNYYAAVSKDTESKDKTVYDVILLTSMSQGETKSIFNSVINRKIPKNWHFNKTI